MAKLPLASLGREWLLGAFLPRPPPLPRKRGIAWVSMKAPWQVGRGGEMRFELCRGRSWSRIFSDFVMIIELVSFLKRVMF